MPAGAAAMTLASAITMSGQREGTVRFTPSRSSTETLSVYPSTEAAVCTTTRLAEGFAASLPMSLIVPPPTATTASESAAA